MAAILRRGGAVRTTEHDLANPSSEVADEALFVALRRLHAKQAEVLATRREFAGFYLIDDQELRQNLGQLIGRIAASHHWDRNSLEERLPKVQGVPGFMPEVWSIQPVKIACLLRCADAIQIDQRRAPAFALAIHGPGQSSLLHWLAQQMSQPLVDSENGDPGALVFTSQNDFTEDKADAWWIAHDLIMNANNELQNCYQLMKDLRLPTFSVNRVAGAESPERLERHVKTGGWRPINAQVRVSTVEQIIRLFGGPLLYGPDPSVPLRELIQNASDAIRARRRLAPSEFYEGRILVSLKRGDEPNVLRLLVEDDGIGMSERVLTGPLLEFGKSFWGSEEAQDEFPGLVSAPLDQGGRFGIGFFSTLMIAQRIEVTSRQWDAAHDQARKLLFGNGLKLRPLVSKSISAPLGEFSTRVELHISSPDADELLNVFNGIHQGSKRVSFKHLVAHLCPTLDCDVWVQEDSNTRELAHSRKWFEIDAQEWAYQINFGESRTDEILEKYLKKEAPFIQVIKDQEGAPRGRAAIAFGAVETGVDTVGRLAVISRSIVQLSKAYVGSIDYEPSGPRRERGSLFDEAAVKEWASAQAVLLGKADISESEKYLAAINVANFGGDSFPLARIMMNRGIATIHDVYDQLAAGVELFVVLDPSGSHEPSIGVINFWPNLHMGIGIAPGELEFLATVLEAWSPHFISDKIYHRIPTNEDTNHLCFIDCLHRYAEAKGRTITLESVTDVLFGTYKGKESLREGLLFGTELRGDAVKITLSGSDEIP
ncbi:MAG: ATP-binding protein [Aliidongia sp.]